MVTDEAAVLSLGTLIQQVFGNGRGLWHQMGGSSQSHHFGEQGRSRRRWNPFPFVLVVVLQRCTSGKIEAPLFAEGLTLGSQLPVDEILRLLLVHRSEQILLDPGQGNNAATGHRRWPSNHGR